MSPQGCGDNPKSCGDSGDKFSPACGVFVLVVGPRCRHPAPAGQARCTRPGRSWSWHPSWWVDRSPPGGPPMARVRGRSCARPNARGGQGGRHGLGLGCRPGRVGPRCRHPAPAGQARCTRPGRSWSWHPSWWVDRSPPGGPPMAGAGAAPGRTHGPGVKKPAVGRALLK